MISINRTKERCDPMCADSPLDNHPFQTQGGLAYRRLCEMIQSGEIKPGESLTLRDLMNRLGISMGAVRDALRHLCERGLVEKLPKYGYRLRPITRARILGYYTVRRALLSESARLAAERITEADVAELRPLAARIDEMNANRLYCGSCEYENDFHSRLGRIAGCPELEAEIVRIGLFHTVLSPRELPPQKGLSHRALLEAIAGGDPFCAEEAMRGHVNDGLAGTLAGFEEAQARRRIAQDVNV